MAYSGEGNLIEGQVEGDLNKTVVPVAVDSDGHLIIDLETSSITIGNVQIVNTASGNTAQVDNTGDLQTDVNNFPANQNVTVTNGAGAAAVNIQDGGNSITVDGTVTAIPTGIQDVNIVGTTVTQPVSGTITTLQGTTPWTINGTVTNTPPANQSVNLTQVGGAAISEGQKPSVTSIPVVIASDQSAIAVTGTITTSPNVNVHDGTGISISSTGSSLNVDVTNTVPVTLTSTTITGNVTVIQPTGTNLHTVVDSGTITLSGTSPVSGTVTSNQGTPNTPANKWPIEIVDSAGVNIASVDATGDVQVDVNNFPATQTVTQGTSPWVVSGTVTANLGTVDGLALNATLTNSTQQTQIVQGGNTAVVDATGDLQVDVNNFPAYTQGSTTSGQLGNLNQAAVTTNAPIYTNSQTSPLSLDTSGNLRTTTSGTDLTGSGTIAANGQTVTTPIARGFSTITYNITGTFAGALIFEGSNDGGVTWFPITPGTDDIGNSITVVANGPGSFTSAAGGFNMFRAIGIFWTSGTAVITWLLSTGINTVAVTNFPPRISSLGISATGASGAAVTATLPAVANQFHYISAIEIVAYTSLARIGVAAPVLVTSTNIPGNPVWDFSTAAAIGTLERIRFEFPLPVRSSAVNTNTTIVCPATLSIIWRVNVFYYPQV